MSQVTVFFALRLGGAAILLAFLGLIFWFLYRDLQQARRVTAGLVGDLGVLRVLANPANDPPANSLFHLAPITTIGRNNRNTIVLRDSFVSGEHALLEWRDTQWWLEDLGSRNGTQLNGVRLSDPTVISAGDIIMIGDIRFKLEGPGWRKEEESGIRDSNP